MKVSLKKYFSMVVIAVLCIAFAIPLLGMESNNLSNAEPIIEIPQVDPPKEDDPNEPIDPDVPVVTVPVFNNAYAAWEYGNNLWQNGDGFELSYYSTSIGSILGVSQTQYIYSEVLANKDQNYEFAIASCDISVGNNNYFYNYREGDNYYRRETENINKANATSIKGVEHTFTDEDVVEEYDYNSFLENVSPNGFKCLCFEFTKASSQLNYFKKMNGNYVFSFNLYPAYVPEAYLQSYALHAGAKNIKFTNIEVIFTMNIKTGKFVSAVKKENYSMKARGIANLTLSATTNYYFKRINEKISIPRPEGLDQYLAQKTTNN